MRTDLKSDCHTMNLWECLATVQRMVCHLGCEEARAFIFRGLKSKQGHNRRSGIIRIWRPLCCCLDNSCADKEAWKQCLSGRTNSCHWGYVFFVCLPGVNFKLLECGCRDSFWFVITLFFLVDTFRPHCITCVVPHRLCRSSRAW